MAKKVGVINMKGGVGKSTLTANLAWDLAAIAHRKVLVVDLDPQFNVSQYLLGVRRYKSDVSDRDAPTAWDIFEQRTLVPGRTSSRSLEPEEVIRTVYERRRGGRLDLVPSRLELALSLRNPHDKDDLLAKFVERVQSEYDLVLVDCAPTESLLTTATYLAVDRILVPVKPDYLSSIGLPLLARSLSEFGKQYAGARPRVAGVVFVATTDYIPEEGLSKREVRAEAKRHRWHVFANTVPYSRSYPKGAREGQPIFRTSYVRTHVANRFHAFATEFVQRVRL